MRLLLIAMVLGVAPVLAQDAPEAGEPPPIAVVADRSSSSDPLTGSVLHDSPTPGEEPRPPAVQAGESGSSTAQPTARGFLYHVFLSAVTALVTALIWRAVF